MLYLIGFVPLLLMPFLSRRVPETRRFLEMQRAGGITTGGWARPMIDLLTSYPFRSAAVGLMALVVTAGSSPAFGLLSDFVQTTHGWKPSSYSLMAIVAGTFGVVGNTMMGRAADRWGRRPVGLMVFGLFPVVVFAAYFGPGNALPVFWIPMIFLLTGGNVLMRMVATELFPTSSRNTAVGWETLMETLGASIGFALVGAATSGSASIAPAIVVVGGLTALGAVMIWRFPETAQRELEATSEIGLPHATEDSDSGLGEGAG